MADDFRPFALLVQRLRNPRSRNDHLDAVEQAATVLDNLSPLAKVVLDAIEADSADCLLIIGEPGKKRYVTVQEAVRALQFSLMRGPNRKQSSQLTEQGKP